MEALSTQYISQARQLRKGERLAQIAAIQKLFARGKTVCSDKVSLAAQTYEMVDKHIRRLDGDLARFEAELKAQANAGVKGGRCEAGEGPGGGASGTGSGGGGGGGGGPSRKRRKQAAGRSAQNEEAEPVPLTGGIPGEGRWEVKGREDRREIVD